jgi:DNA-binding NarL/FixJ family response regulator
MRGRLHAAAGEHRAALEELTAAGAAAEAWGVRNPATMPWRSSAAVSLATLGEHAQARALAAEELARARRWGAGRAIGVALRAAGLAQPGREGIALLDEAARTLAQAPAPLEHARALTDLGARLRRDGRRTEARDQLARALDLAHHCGGIALARRAREELVLAGAKPRRDALRGRDALTPGELRVAQLATTGATNRAIAEALFVTPRTVEHHLTSAYAKLSISSRDQLADALSGSASPS